MRVSISQDELSRHLEEISKLGLKKSFDSSPAHAVITDDNANIIYANKAVESHTGFSPEECVGKNPADLWGGSMSKKFYEDMWYTIKIKKQPFVGEMLNKKKDGTTYWQELLIAPVLEENGEVKFFIGIEPEIGDKKKQQQFKEQFISALGHQTRNPLITIRWMLEKILAHSELGQTERQELEKIYQENQTLINLVSDLLILSRVEGFALEAETVHLDIELEKSIEAIIKKYPNVNIIFENEIGPATINVVKSLALQVFTNIMYNAAEHADKEYGKVVIKLQNFEQGILFSCQNNGEPIPEPIKPQIFTRLTSASGGAGLGLFIVKMISDYFGWQVSFDTGEEGTIFYVKIPFPNQ